MEVHPSGMTEFYISDCNTYNLALGAATAVISSAIFTCFNSAGADGLPDVLSAGELSPVLAWILCIGLAASGLGITAANFGREITLLYAFGLFLGTIYSVPPLR